MLQALTALQIAMNITKPVIVNDFNKKYLEPVITVSSIKKFSKYFRQSLVLELYWENSIDFKKIEKSFTNDEKISRIALVRKFFSKVFRNLIR